MSYHLFISHSWNYTKQYDGLLNLLSKTNLSCKNYSASRENPITDTRTDAQLREAIKQKMRPVSCVIVLAGVYASRSKWIEVEIELAKELNKKIVGVRPRGNERISQLVQDNAYMMVNWNSDSLASAIRRAAIA